MLRELFRGLTIAHGLLLALGAAGFAVFWARTRFWVPKYVHVLAGFAFVVGYWVVSTATPDTPLGKEGPLSKFLFALILPAIVYGYFVFFGGQKAVYKRRFRRRVPCPYCNAPVVVYGHGRSSVDVNREEGLRCPRCGQPVPAGLTNTA